MKVLGLLFVLLAVTANREQSPRELFEQFKVDYAKSYSTTQEEEYRFGVFIENLKLAEIRNQESKFAVHGVTKFMDITPEEFKATYLGFRPKLVETPRPFTAPAASARVSCSNTTSCNYFDLGAVTPVKDQGQCGSCWAFSTTESVETAWFMGGHPLTSLAPQQIVDCDKTDAGCNGGDTPTAYDYVEKAGGLETEANYPYTAKDGTCKFDSSKVAASINTFHWGIPPCNTLATHACDNQNETALLQVVANSGPQSICVDAEPWQTYIKGVYSSSKCKHGYYDLDHCVHLTGYGVDSGVKYWLVKNSWGATWGEKGYIWLEMGVNMCGVADEVTYSVST